MKKSELVAEFVTRLRNYHVESAEAHELNGDVEAAVEITL